VARGWRLNPPPNWPAPPTDWEPDADWRPDPAWGPAPVGWTLWTRETRTAWVRRHRLANGFGGVAIAMSGVVVMPLVALLAGLIGTSGSRPAPVGAAAPVAEAARSLGRTVPPSVADHDVPPVAGGSHGGRDWKVEPAVRLPRRSPVVSRVRRVAPRPTTTPAQPVLGLTSSAPAGATQEPSPTPAVTSTEPGTGPGAGEPGNGPTCSPAPTGHPGGCGPSPRPTDPGLPGDSALAPPA
jgi:hypothetical protein